MKLAVEIIITVVIGVLIVCSCIDANRRYNNILENVKNKQEEE